MTTPFSAPSAGVISSSCRMTGWSGPSRSPLAMRKSEAVTDLTGGAGHCDSNGVLHGARTLAARLATSAAPSRPRRPAGSCGPRSAPRCAPPRPPLAPPLSGWASRSSRRKRRFTSSRSTSMPGAQPEHLHRPAPVGTDAAPRAPPRAARPASTRPRTRAAAAPRSSGSATMRSSTSAASPPQRPSTTRRIASSATVRPARVQRRRAHHRAEHLRDRRAVDVELDDDAGRPRRASGGATGRGRARRTAAGAAARSAGSRGRGGRRASRRGSSSRCSSSIAGRLVATTAASSAAPCAGPDVGRYAPSSATRRVGMCRRVWRTFSSASSTATLRPIFGPGCRGRIQLSVPRDDQQDDDVHREQHRGEQPEPAAGRARGRPGRGPRQAARRAARPRRTRDRAYRTRRSAAWPAGPRSCGRVPSPRGARRSPRSGATAWRGSSGRLRRAGA